MPDGWVKPTVGAKYAGVAERTFRPWLRNGLKHSILPSGHILIKLADIDKYLEKFSTADSREKKIVNEIMRGF
jgi:hypothetical protein